MALSATIMDRAAGADPDEVALPDRGVSREPVANDLATGPGAGLLAALRAVDVALAGVPSGVDVFAGLSDTEVLVQNGAHARRRDVLARIGAELAGQVVLRSDPALGSGGLAQRTGFRTPIELVKVTTRATGREAVTAVRTGTLLVEAVTDGAVDIATGVVFTATEPWLRPVAHAVTAGGLSLAAADAIRAGLGTPTTAVSVETLTTAAGQLVRAAGILDPDAVRKLARRTRDELDAAGIPLREQERYDTRALRMFDRPNGGGRAIMDFDPESWATAKTLYDRLTSPRRGGPRFVHTENTDTSTSDTSTDSQIADRILADTRTTEQLAFDGFLHLLTAGADADSSELLGSGAPVVTFLTTIDTTTATTATTTEEFDTNGTIGDRGWIEGQADPVSAATITRALETGSTEIIGLDHHGHLLEPGTYPDTEAGTGRRLFNRRQRRALAARDGGCRWPHCGRPPSWTEAHHLTPWTHSGPTHVNNGILLCRHHHLLLHNNHWEIHRTTTPYRGGPDPTATAQPEHWLIPPADIDPSRTPRPMPSMSGAWSHRGTRSESTQPNPA